LASPRQHDSLYLPRQRRRSAATPGQTRRIPLAPNRTTARPHGGGLGQGSDAPAGRAMRPAVDLGCSRRAGWQGYQAGL